MKLIIHNFYGRFVPSGENELVRSKKKLFSKKIFRFSDIFYTKKNKFLILYSALKYQKKIVKNINSDNKISYIEIHNTFPLINLFFLKKLKNKLKINLYLHNFRMAAPCGYLMTPANKSCDLCLHSRKKGFIKSLYLKCYRNSFFLTLASHIINNLHRVFGVYKHISQVTTFSEYHSLTIKRYLDEDCEINLISNKVNYLKDVKRNNHKKSNNVVFMGRLSSEKGILELAKFWSKNPHLPDLHIYGKGHLQNKLNEIANMCINIEMKGYADLEMKKKIYSECNALIIPSICAEGYPVTLSEAVELKIPVIVNNVEPLVNHCKDIDHLVIDLNQLDSVKLFNYLNGTML